MLNAVPNRAKAWLIHASVTQLTPRAIADTLSAMKRRSKIAIALAALAVVMTGAALSQSGSAPGSPPGEAPELARAGQFSVGTLTEQITLPKRLRITAMAYATGNLPAEDRSLSVRIWYPAAAAAAGRAIRYSYAKSFDGRPPLRFETQGIAIENAPALIGKRFPLVLISHGFGGWSSYMSNLAEALAAQGYVVASIDHADKPFAGKTSFLLSFANVLLDRAQDQRQVLARLVDEAQSTKSGYAAQIDVTHIGLIGYSMGGFGALATAGAPYDGASNTISQLPKSAQQVVLAGDATASANIKALVAIAPWGGQPDNRSWTAYGLSKITMPVLLIDGDHDDIVDYRHGVSWIYDHLTGTDRRLLVYREARHNIMGNPFSLGANADFQTLEYFSEPVWRTERLNMINQHFITAFLDLTLKGDEKKAAWLDVPAENAGDGDWPSAFGQRWGGTLAGNDQPKYWRGFQRRWALGLELHHAEKGVSGTQEAH